MRFSKGDTDVEVTRKDIAKELADFGIHNKFDAKTTLIDGRDFRIAVTLKDWKGGLKSETKEEIKRKLYSKLGVLLGADTLTGNI